jgi:hypothetical protein
VPPSFKPSPTTIPPLGPHPARPSTPFPPSPDPFLQDMPIPEGLDPRQRAAAEGDWQFLLQLLDNRRVGEYEIPVDLKV